MVLRSPCQFSTRGGRFQSLWLFRLNRLCPRLLKRSISQNMNNKSPAHLLIKAIKLKKPTALQASTAMAKKLGERSPNKKPNPEPQ